MMTEESEKDWLDDFARDDDVAETPSEQPEQTEADEGPARDEHGRFAKQKTGEEAQEAEPAEGDEQSADTGEESAAEQPASPPPGDKPQVPIAALQAERAKSKAFEARIAALEERLAQPPTPAPAQPQPAAEIPPPPDPIDDPQGYNRWRDQQQENAILNERMNFSELTAREKHGDEKVDAALQAFKSASDPGVMQRIRASRHPYGELLKWHEEATTLTAIQEAGGLDAYIAKRLEEQAQAAPAAAGQGQTQQPRQPAPPPSLARGGAGDAKSEILSGDEEFYAAFR